MKQNIFVLLLICGFAVSSKADSIEYWKVYYNDNLIGEYSLHDSIIISNLTLKKDDIIRVDYFNKRIEDIGCDKEVKLKDYNYKYYEDITEYLDEKSSAFHIGTFIGKDYINKSFIIFYSVTCGDVTVEKIGLLKIKIN
ncbi:MAG: hypothetical protein ACXWDO_10155, partial [Bacteroidia bacterium]